MRAEQARYESAMTIARILYFFINSALPVVFLTGECSAYIMIADKSAGKMDKAFIIFRRIPSAGKGAHGVYGLGARRDVLYQTRAVYPRLFRHWLCFTP